VTSSELIDRLWSDSPLFLTREEFEQSLAGCEFDPVVHEGATVGVFVVKGPEFHFAKWDPLHQCSRDILRRYPGELIERYGYALTRTPKDDARQRRFNERLGFCAVGEDEYDVIYRIEKLRVKEAPCQS
jgi:hypothetical protein